MCSIIRCMFIEVYFFCIFELAGVFFGQKLVMFWCRCECWCCCCGDFTFGQCIPVYHWHPLAFLLCCLWIRTTFFSTSQGLQRRLGFSGSEELAGRTSQKRTAWEDLEKTDGGFQRWWKPLKRRMVCCRRCSMAFPSTEEAETAKLAKRLGACNVTLFFPASRWCMSSDGSISVSTTRHLPYIT